MCAVVYFKWVELIWRGGEDWKHGEAEWLLHCYTENLCKRSIFYFFSEYKHDIIYNFLFQEALQNNFVKHFVESNLDIDLEKLFQKMQVYGMSKKVNALITLIRFLI